MKSKFFWIVTLCLAGSGVSLCAEDWKTTDGKVYQDVKVIDLKSDAVTILHHDGGGVIPLAKLPPDLQKRFGYDPVKAVAAAETRAKVEVANGQALQAEMDLAARQRSVSANTPAPSADVASDAPSADTDSSDADEDEPTSDTPTGPLPETPPTTAPKSPSTASADATTDPSPAAVPARGDATHYSIDSLTSSLSLRPSLQDPTYHTTAHMVYEINNQGLGPDTSDPSHHSMDEIAHPSP